MDFKLEVVVVPVADVDQAKDFYKAHRAQNGGRVTGPAPNRASYGSFASCSDPDGNLWFIQEITTRLPGR